MSTPPNFASNLLGLVLRIGFPCAILAAGWFGFQYLADQAERPPAPKAKEFLLRSRVEEMEVVDYAVEVKTHAVVQPHNLVTISSQVSGAVAKVSPLFEVGAYFREGETLVEIDPRDYKTALSMAKSQLTAAQSELKLAKVVEDRKLRLIESNAVSQGEVDAASASREQAEANVALAESQVEQAELELERTKVIAPFNGRVKSKLIGLGQLAGNNTPLGEVFAIDYVEVRLPISGEQRKFLDLPEFPGDPPIRVELRDGINASNDTVWTGQIVRTEGVLDEDSRDLFAIARIDDPFGRESGKPPLRISQPVLASIEGKVLKDVIALPRGAVRQLDNIVLVNRANKTLLPLKIEALWSDAEKVIVPSAAIPQGTWLATTPLPFTPKGAEIEIIPPAETSVSIADSTAADSDTNTTN
ncbi:efflux RND transporter periplasmic adaptor subunit [Blastopirellula marina]|uniref:Efflux RND transporter periplasmic adaptor subunit n=1 Tax=Blastopirellula marina TaxID=124 RepID=A0A2S8G1B3_9BACT|nr:efflux RND transporter periplasmic adaptor subunit [Blastopirellula marina]PQO38051.1 efflux RND transporter periplasmic adaptor subunit [Blastopirellula marina]PTL44707.1 efflux RND transporter periplasmic adaptor subunit [Blastopirellula marina]